MTLRPIIYVLTCFTLFTHNTQPAQTKEHPYVYHGPEIDRLRAWIEAQNNANDQTTQTAQKSSDRKPDLTSSNNDYETSHSKKFTDVQQASLIHEMLKELKRSQTKNSKSNIEWLENSLQSIKNNNAKNKNVPTSYTYRERYLARKIEKLKSQTTKC